MNLLAMNILGMATQTWHAACPIWYGQFTKGVLHTGMSQETRDECTVHHGYFLLFILQQCINYYSYYCYNTMQHSFLDCKMHYFMS